MYSFENPIAGATTAYSGKKSIVKTNDPGIARQTEDLARECTHHKETHTSDGVFRPKAVYIVSLESRKTRYCNCLLGNKRRFTENCQ